MILKEKDFLIPATGPNGLLDTAILTDSSNYDAHER